jgi:DNA-directed RNA polymerase subunit RPC12/RpoP
MNTNKWVAIFLYCAGAILLLAGLERLLVAASDAPALALPDPILGIPLRLAAAIIGALELAAACLCLLTQRTQLQLAFLTGLMAGYATYWTCAAMTGVQSQGTAIGGLTDPLRLTNGVLGTLIAFLPAGLILGIGSTLFLNRKKAPAKPASKPLSGPQKMTCPACGGHIRFEAGQIGQQINCPHCQKNIALRPPEILKTLCAQCGNPIEFPSHALGRKMPCPHCKTDLILKESA